MLKKLFLDNKFTNYFTILLFFYYFFIYTDNEQDFMKLQGIFISFPISFQLFFTAYCFSM